MPIERGFGDTLHNILKRTGIVKVVKSLTDDCGCEERQQTLNKVIPYETS